MAMVKELWNAYSNNELPTDGGYILSAFFESSSTYTRYEVISYNNVKSIYPSDDGLTFQADGKKLFVLVEPADYPNKHTEPAYRDDQHKIPYRLKELEVHVSKRQDRIMVGRQPVITYTAFTVLKSTGNNFSYIIYNTDDLREILRKFFETTLWKDAHVPQSDAVKTTEIIMNVFEDMATVRME